MQPCVPSHTTTASLLHIQVPLVRCSALPNPYHSPETRMSGRRRTFSLPFVGELETSGLNLDHLDPYLPFKGKVTFFLSETSPCTITMYPFFCVQPSLFN